MSQKRNPRNVNEELQSFIETITYNNDNDNSKDFVNTFTSENDGELRQELTKTISRTISLTIKHYNRQLEEYKAITINDDFTDERKEEILKENKKTADKLYAKIKLLIQRTLKDRLNGKPDAKSKALKIGKLSPLTTRFTFEFIDSFNPALDTDVALEASNKIKNAIKRLHRSIIKSMCDNLHMNDEIKGFLSETAKLPTDHLSSDTGTRVWKRSSRSRISRKSILVSQNNQNSGPNKNDNNNDDTIIWKEEDPTSMDIMSNLNSDEQTQKSEDDQKSDATRSTIIGGDDKSVLSAYPETVAYPMVEINIKETTDNWRKKYDQPNYLLQSTEIEDDPNSLSNSI